MIVTSYSYSPIGYKLLFVRIGLLEWSKVGRLSFAEELRKWPQATQPRVNLDNAHFANGSSAENFYISSE